MDMDPIVRDENKLARTRFCQEETGGGITINTEDGGAYQIGPEEMRDGPAFSQIWLRLTPKRWFTPEVAIDFVNVVQARWWARAHGYI